MAVNHPPQPGIWFTNLNGQNFLVFAVSYRDGEISKVVLRYMSGVQKIINTEDWRQLDLIRRHLPPRQMVEQA